MNFPKNHATPIRGSGKVCLVIFLKVLRDVSLNGIISVYYKPSGSCNLNGAIDIARLVKKVL